MTPIPRIIKRTGGGSGGGGGGGAPSGSAGGVLGGTYPDPTFAVDMATQAELDAAKKYTQVHTVAIMGAVAVPSGTTDVIPPFFFSMGSGETAVIKEVRFQIGAGTSVTAKLTKNGSDIAEYSGANDLDITTTPAQVAPGSPPSVAENDIIQFVVTAVSGSPENLSASIAIEVT